MKIALLADIHGNAVALEAALTDLQQAAPDAIVCLGDVVVTGPQPREALARLRALSCPIVMGNTDAWVLHPKPFTIRNERDQILYDLELWGTNQLTKEDKAFVRTFQPTVKMNLGNGRSLLCSHGSPRSNTEAIEATLSDADLSTILSGHQADIFASGHTHAPLLRRFKDGFVLNPGSVGLPFYRGSAGNFINPARAEYALIAVTPDNLAISLHRVRYAFDDLVTAVTRSTMPHQQAFLADWVPDGA